MMVPNVCDRISYKDYQIKHVEADHHPVTFVKEHGHTQFTIHLIPYIYKEQSLYKNLYSCNSKTQQPLVLIKFIHSYISFHPNVSIFYHCMAKTSRESHFPYHLTTLTRFSLQQLISMPISTIYMPKYSQNMNRIKVVRLPYILYAFPYCT